VIPEKMDYATVRDDIENPVIEEPEEVK